MIGNNNALNVPTKLLDDDSFYSVLRVRVTKHLKEAGYPDGGPTE